TNPLGLLELRSRMKQLGDRLRHEDRTIPHARPLRSKNDFCQAGCSESYWQKEYERKPGLAQRLRLSRFGHEAVQILQSSSTSVARASIFHHSKALWMLMLRLRNRASFGAEELQSCLDNLQELKVKTQSRILRKRMNYSDFFILVHSVMF